MWFGYLLNRKISEWYTWYKGPIFASGCEKSEEMKFFEKTIPSHPLITRIHTRREWSRGRNGYVLHYVETLDIAPTLGLLDLPGLISSFEENEEIEVVVGVGRFHVAPAHL